MTKPRNDKIDQVEFGARIIRQSKITKSRSDGKLNSFMTLTEFGHGLSTPRPGHEWSRLAASGHLSRPRTYLYQKGLKSDVSNW